MSLSQLLLAVWLILVGLTWVGWAALSADFLGVLAIITGIIFVLEGTAVWSYRLGGDRR